MKPKSIAIIGLGLMGGSLAAACRKKFSGTKIIGITRNRAALRTALKKKWVHQAAPDLKRGVQSADLIVLCTPVNTLKPLLQQIDRFARRGTLVTDAGSVKSEIVSWAGKRKFKNITFVGAHPMTGSHERGIEAANPDIYRKGFTFVTRTAKTQRAAFTKVKDFWKKISPRVVEITPEAHDIITSQISHVPHLIAACLVLAADPKSLPFAGPGFIDATRIAQGHPSVWLPIFIANRKAVLKAVSGFEKKLSIFKKALSGAGSGQARFLEKILAQAGQERAQISPLK